MSSESGASKSHSVSGSKQGKNKQKDAQDLKPTGSPGPTTPMQVVDENRSNDAEGISRRSLRRSSRRSSKREVTRKQHMQAESSEYNLPVEVNAPRLNGWKLRFLARATTSRLLGKYLVNSGFRRAKFYHFRTIHLSEEPTYFPNPKTFDGRAATPEEPRQSEYKDLVPKLSDSSETTGFRFFSIYDYYNAYRKGTTTPVEVAEWVITKVKESRSMKPALGAVTQMDEDSVRRMAKESTGRFGKNQSPAGEGQSGKEGPLSCLDGVPVLIKEEINCVPYKTRCGTNFLGENPVTEDSTIPRKLKEAGAIIVGLSNMHELGMGVLGYNIHPNNGMPRNPYNPDHYTGGSSSGSAAAVAAGLVPIAIGTDGGGSIRVPATLCGNVGLKPTFGRVSFGGNEESCHSVVHAGPICTNVNDAALVYALLAGPDPKDPFSMNQPKIALKEYDQRRDLKGVRIGVDRNYLEDSQPAVVQASEEAIKMLKDSHGAEIIDIKIPELQELRIAHTMVILSEMREGFNEHYRDHLHDLSPENQTMMRLMKKVNATDYIGANKQRTRTIHFFKEIFKNVDIIVTPACGRTAPKIERGDERSGCTDMKASLEIAKYMLFGNLTGLPGLVVPIAYHNGLPIGLQISGRWWEEDLVLAVGKFTEGILQSKQKPEIFFPNECLNPTCKMDNKQSQQSDHSS